MDKFEKLQDFLDKHSELVDIANDADHYIYKKDYDKLYDLLEQNESLLRQYPGYKDVEITRPNIEKEIENLYEEYGQSQPEEQYVADIAKGLNVPSEDISLGLQHKQQEEQLKEKVEQEAADREMRKQMLKSIPWYFSPIAHLMMSEDEQNRFVNDPEHSAFYQNLMAEYEDDMKKSMGYYDMSSKDKEAFEQRYPGLFQAHPWKGTLSSRIDAGLGAAGTALDFLAYTNPITAIAGGPTLRALRSIKNKLTGESKKSGSDIAWDVAGDVGTNIGTDLLPTLVLNKISKVGKGLGKLPTGAIAETIEDAKLYRQSKKLDKELDKVGDLTSDALDASMKAKTPLAEAKVEHRFEQSLEDSPFASDIKAYRDKSRAEYATELEGTMPAKYAEAEAEAAIPTSAAATDFVNEAKTRIRDFNAGGSGVKARSRGVEVNVPEPQQYFPVEIIKIRQDLGPTAAALAKSRQMSRYVGPGPKKLAGLADAYEIAGSGVVKAIDRERAKTEPESSYDKEAQLQRLGLGKTKTKPQYTKQELEDYLSSGPIPNARLFEGGFLPGEMAKIGQSIYVKKPEWEESLPVQAYRYWQEQQGK